MVNYVTYSDCCYRVSCYRTPNCNIIHQILPGKSCLFLVFDMKYLFFWPTQYFLWPHASGVKKVQLKKRTKKHVIFCCQTLQMSLIAVQKSQKQDRITPCFCFVIVSICVQFVPLERYLNDLEIYITTRKPRVQF